MQPQVAASAFVSEAMLLPAQEDFKLLRNIPITNALPQ